MKVLLTGVAGFIGSHTARRFLERGYTVVGLDTLSPENVTRVPRGVVAHSVDICSPEIEPLFDGVDVVFHFAAKNSLQACQKDPVGATQVNLVGMANVFAAAQKAGVRRVVYAQSSIVEEGPDRQKGFYAICKRAGEMLAEGFQETGLPVVALRYFNVYGPGQDYRRSSMPIMSRFIVTLLRGGQPILFEEDEKNIRDYVHVDDLADFHVLCVEDDRVDNRLFRLGSGVNYSPIQILSAIQEILGTNVAPQWKPRLPGDPPVQTKADISAAAELGWRPKTGLGEGLCSMVAYVKEEIAAGRLAA